MLDLALKYASKGWPVFPLAPGTKVPPKGHHGRLEATTDKSFIYSWFADNALSDPDPNIGIDTEGAGLVVIDIDIAKEARPLDAELYGFDAWEAMLLTTGDAKADHTYTVETPSGGVHLYWLANDAFPVKKSVSVLAPGIDTMAISGQIVAAGSRTDKGVYKVVRDITPKPLPSWLRTKLWKARLAITEVEVQARPTPPPVRSSDNYAQAAFDGEIEALKVASQGTRNDALNRAAFKLKRFVDSGQLNGASVADVLYGVATNDLGMNAREATQTIKSGLGV